MLVVAFGSLAEAADAGRGTAAEANGREPELLLLAVDIAPRADFARKAAGSGPCLQGSGVSGAGGNGFSPGLGEIAEVAKRGWRRCLPLNPHSQPMFSFDKPRDRWCRLHAVVCCTSAPL